MRCALNVPNFGAFSDPRGFMALARTAEESGWDGLFVWDHLIGMPGVPVADPWVLLSAAAVVTERIRVGTMVTPLARRRPWQVARQTVTLDHLTDGRVTLGVGLGTPVEHDFAPFGEETDPRRRARLLDDGLELLDRLWRTGPVSLDRGTRADDEVAFLPGPVQQPRIPVWVGGVWPHRRPLRRAARWDGALPLVESEMGPVGPSPERLVPIVEFLRAERDAAGQPPEPFDIGYVGSLPDDDGARSELAGALEAAGATWWHVLPGFGEPLEAFAERILTGPAQPCS